jgi:hypothetical protein
MEAPMDVRLLAAKAVAVVAFLIWVAIRPSPFLRVVTMCFLGQALYAIVQDQVSARLCSEYFTAAHQRVGDIEDPTLLGIVWGVLAGGSGGMVMGLFVGAVATHGRLPVLNVRDVLRPLAVVLLTQATATALCGLSVFLNLRLAHLRLVGPFALSIPSARHEGFFIVACMHIVTYATAILGSLGLCVWAVRRRRSALPVVTS